MLHEVCCAEWTNSWSCAKVHVKILPFVDLDGEIIGKRFNTRTGLGVEVPIELRFVGNQKYLQKLSLKIKAVVTLEMEKNDDSCAKLFLSQHGISEVKPLQDN